MKLLTAESNAIKEILEDQFGLIDSYSLIKKKGWVFIHVNESKFGFHRKKSLVLINGQFKEQIQYYIRIDKLSKPLNEFSEVLDELVKWLKQLP